MGRGHVTLQGCQYTAVPCFCGTGARGQTEHSSALSPTRVPNTNRFGSRSSHCLTTPAGFTRHDHTAWRKCLRQCPETAKHHVFVVAVNRRPGIADEALTAKLTKRKSRLQPAAHGHQANRGLSSRARRPLVSEARVGGERESLASSSPRPSSPTSASWTDGRCRRSTGRTLPTTDSSLLHKTFRGRPSRSSPRHRHPRCGRSERRRPDERGAGAFARLGQPVDRNRGRRGPLRCRPCPCPEAAIRRDAGGYPGYGPPCCTSLLCAPPPTKAGALQASNQSITAGPVCVSCFCFGRRGQRAP